MADSESPRRRERGATGRIRRVRVSRRPGDAAQSVSCARAGCRGALGGRVRLLPRRHLEQRRGWQGSMARAAAPRRRRRAGDLRRLERGYCQQRGAISGLAGEWSSPETRAAWSEAYRELGASPPLSHFYTRRAGLSIRLAAYVRECVPPSERLLVLWFAPDIFFQTLRPPHGAAASLFSSRNGPRSRASSKTRSTRSAVLPRLSSSHSARPWTATRRPATRE